MSKKYDVIIIGSGIGGLICGTKLAKVGLNVLIVEKNERPGGCVTSCIKKGFNFDYGAHIFGSCNKTGILNYCLKELQVNDIDFIRLNPTERFIFPDQTIEVPQNIDEYIDLLKNRFPKEANNVDLFFNEVLKIAKNFSSYTLLSRDKNLAFLSRYKKETFEMFLKSHFKDDKLMSILTAQCRYLGSTPKNLAAIPTCLMTVSYLRDGTYYSRGGTQEVPDSIVRKLQKYGGTIFLEREASKILIRNRKVAGIETKDGEVFESDIVVSNADAIKTFFDLIDRNEIDQAYLKRIGKMKIGSSFFIVYLGVKDSVNLTKKSGWYHFSYSLNPKPDQSLYIFSPSLVDGSLAPKNKHVVELALPFPYDFESVKDWSSCKKELRDKVLNMAEKIIPGLQDAIEFEESATPKTIEKYTCNSHGSVCGWEMNVGQAGEDRLACSTTIHGLYLTGHWTNPGCGVVPVATSGWIVADKIMEKLNVKSNKSVLAGINYV